MGVQVNKVGVWFDVAVDYADEVQRLVVLTADHADALRNRKYFFDTRKVLAGDAV
jgi:hypothetical protein